MGPGRVEGGSWGIGSRSSALDEGQCSTGWEAGTGKCRMEDERSWAAGFYKRFSIAETISLNKVQRRSWRRLLTEIEPLLAGIPATKFAG